MFSKKSGGDADTRAPQPLAIRPLELRAISLPVLPQRRRLPRRQIVVGCIVERRVGDRRRRQPGIDGLLRMVLSDSWK